MTCVPGILYLSHVLPGGSAWEASTFGSGCDPWVLVSSSVSGTLLSRSLFEDSLSLSVLASTLLHPRT